MLLSLSEEELVEKFRLTEEEIMRLQIWKEKQNEVCL
jgi:hypothetical protein